MSSLSHLRVRIYADGADRAGIVRLHALPFIHGITTNPTLMRKAGVADYEAFAREVLQVVTDKPVSFEVLSDEFPDMRRQALKISGWGKNVYTKIPITNSRGETSVPLIRELAAAGVKVNVTAILTLAQVRAVAEVLRVDVPAVVSVFAGRIADTGVDPMPIMREARPVFPDLRRAATHCPGGVPRPCPGVISLTPVAGMSPTRRSEASTPETGSLNWISKENSSRRVVSGVGSTASGPSRVKRSTARPRGQAAPRRRLPTQAVCAYARRQATWFRGEPGIAWLDGDADPLPGALAAAQALLGETAAPPAGRKPPAAGPPCPASQRMDLAPEMRRVAGSEPRPKKRPERCPSRQ